jgi:hypothetical protein
LGTLGAPSALASSFTQCPAVGADTTGCGLLITFNADGSVTASDSGQGPYDGADDTLIGIQNNTPITINSLPLTSTANPPAFQFDGDGICSGLFNPMPTGCPFSSDPTFGDYAGPGVTYTNISMDQESGTVNFASGIAPGASDYFSLEGPITASSITIPITPTQITLNAPGTGGSGSGDYNDATTVSGTLTDNAGNPVAGETLSFSLNGSESCSGTTNAQGVATCQVTPGEAAGPYPLTASFAGDATHSGSNKMGTFTVTKEETSLSLDAPTVVHNGQATTLSGTLREDGLTPIANRSVSFTLGSGSSAQTAPARPAPEGRRRAR